MANLRQSVRWQEFVPLFSQQCRLRHLVRITAFNVGTAESGKLKEIRRINPHSSPAHSVAHIDGPLSDACVYYYTLHLTTMSAPFYKSEKLQGGNPRWAELEIQDIIQASASLVSKGVVVRIWKHKEEETLEKEKSTNDTLVTAWGVYFSGLVPIPMAHSSLCVPSSLLLGPNAIIFHMQGGMCYTSPHCLAHLSSSDGKENATEDGGKDQGGVLIVPTKEQKGVEGGHVPRDITSKKSSMSLAESDVRSSYTLSLLLRLRTVEHAIRKQAVSAGALRERISAASVLPSNYKKTMKSSSVWSHHRSNNGLSPKFGISSPGSLFSSSPTTLPSSRIARRQALSEALVTAESLRLCVSILKGERIRKLSEVRLLSSKGQELAIHNKERGKELKDQQESLMKEIEHLREWRHREFLEARDAFLHTSAHLAFRRRQLVSELSLIYPILQHPNGGYTICGVKLPNSEDFGPRDEVMVSVALGYVAHAVQMVSIFLHVPLRYPVAHLGSRSRISDLVADKIPDGEREFPLFSRAKDKLQFKYGVYLLNKNVAQLRWYCGLSTQDLRATLPNLAALFYPKAGPGSLVNSSSISNFIAANVNGQSLTLDRSPLGSHLPQGHRRTHSGSSPNLQARDARQCSTYESGSGEGQPLTRPFERGHRVSRSAGGKGELLLPPSSDVLAVQGQKKEGKNQLQREDESNMGLCGVKGSNLSYSLDKGLDEYKVIHRVSHHKEQSTVGSREASDNHREEGELARVCSTLAIDSSDGVTLDHVGSDPLLRNILVVSRGVERLEGEITVESRDSKPSTEARRRFLHGWHLSGCGAPAQSDEDAESSVASEEPPVQALNNNVSLPLLSCPSLPHREGSPRINMNDQLSSSLATEKASMIPSSLIASSTAEVDRLFASVASRTEALASRSTSFNLVRSRQGSTTEEGAS